MIYFITQEYRYVKIGFTEDNPEAEMASMQPGNPFPLRLYKVVAGTKDKAREIHSQFEGLKVCGEWFYLTASLMEYIDGADPVHNGLCNSTWLLDV